MADNRANDNDSKGNDSEEENEILEESPCGRWLKRKEEVEQRDIPGIDATYLAMDTDEGVEVVWNEVRFSERKIFKTKEETINEVFDRLVQLEHPNIVKLHKYWVEKDIEKPRVIFITEYMSCGSLKQFLRKTKKNLIRMALSAWKRWCTQTLSALCYLHSSQPPIIHANLNCDTIFISYNGLIKIGAVAPDAIHKHVKTVRGDSKANLHFIAPEIGSITDSNNSVIGPPVDIYSFGMCALEMAALEIATNGETAAPTTTTNSLITDDVINNTIESLENPLQKDFITRCLHKNPKERPTARELLFHPIIFEVPTLRLFAAHVIAKNPSYQPELYTEEAINRVLCLQNNDRVLAEICHPDGRPSVSMKSDSTKLEFEKYIEEVRNGSYPLTAILTTTRLPLISRQRTMSPEVSGESSKQLNSPDNPFDEETRRIQSINSTLEPNNNSQEPSDIKQLVISLHIIFDDKINRKLTTKLDSCELDPSSLAQELIFYGFVNKDDEDIVCELLSETRKLFTDSANSQSVSCQKMQKLSQQTSSSENK
ncbi:nuclear receptor-binding protein-like [Oppia nitens]|uniref:nuclear receptor-binding protein-like n=1 Tax=Oppia nitens TaxID=1686743 RepID=UPI0023DC9550|nr:nuclear receptor-binding protein-like [Oppia nitens]